MPRVSTAISLGNALPTCRNNICLSEPNTMPAISDLLRSTSKPRSSPIPAQPITTYYLSSSPPSPVSLRPITPPNRLHPIPPSTLLFSLTHPDLSLSEPTFFFLTCLPDPIGFLLHSALFIRSHLIPSSNPQLDSNWRHQLIDLVLEDKPGLAATSGGRIHISLHWVGSILGEVKASKRDMQSAVKEFKGVCKSQFPFSRMTYCSLTPHGCG